MAPALALAEAIPAVIARLDAMPQSVQTPAMSADQPVLLANDGGEGRVLIKDIRILRNQRFAQSELKPLVAGLIGRELGFAEIETAAGGIGAFYRDHGHRARAILPQQTVHDGIVRIVVIEDESASVQTAAVRPAQAERARQKPGRAVPDEQHEVGKFFAARYRLEYEVLQPFVTAAYLAGEESSVDPLLILAVIAVESSFNPAAKSVRGAKGLMQVIAKFHRKKLAPHGDYEGVLLDPFVNVRIGTQILREYLERFGALETALQMYGGALNDPSSAYARKVLDERARVEQVLVALRGAV